jgi:phosphate transport system permease protein
VSDLSLPQAPLQLADLRGDPRRLRTERVVRVLLTAAAAVSVLISAGIVWSLAREAFTFVTEIEWSTVLLSEGWFPRQGVYDLRTLHIGTLWDTVIAMAVAMPIGHGAAI